MSISLLMTVRDGERFLAEALTSVLEQSRPPTEIVVVDDGSSDGTGDVLRSFGSALSVHHRAPLGITSSFNFALDKARYDVIAHLDADDVMPANGLAVRYEALNQQPETVAVGGRLLQFVTPQPTCSAEYRVEPGPVRGALFGALLLRRAAFDAVGPLDESLPLMAKVDWVARARALHLPFHWLDDVVLHRRIHGRNTTLLKREQMEAEMFELVRRQRARSRSRSSGP